MDEYSTSSHSTTSFLSSCYYRAGGPITDKSNSDLIRVPPLSLPLRQHIIEKLVKEGDGETKRVSQLEGELFAVSAKANNDTLDLVCFDVLMISESASSGESLLPVLRQRCCYV